MNLLEDAPDWKNETHLTEAVSRVSQDPDLAIIREINNEYFYWDKLKYRVPENWTAQTLWSAVKWSRTSQYKRAAIGTYVLKYYVSDSMLERLHRFDMFLGGKLGAETILPDKNKEQYIVSSLMEESIASSQIEGAVTTRKLAKEMLRNKTTPQNQSERMIFNNYRTIQWIVGHKSAVLDEKTLMHIHRSMCEGTMDDSKDVGRYRVTDDVAVVNASTGDVVHIPPAKEELGALMADVFSLFNGSKNEEFVHPIVMASILHFAIGFIHPFADGNGRTARALFYWYMMKSGYWMTEYLSISRIIFKSKPSYEKAYLYAEKDGLDVGYFIHYQLRTMELAVKDLKAYIARKVEEKKTVKDLLRFPNVHERQAHILKWMDDDASEVLTVNGVASRLAIKYHPARSDLMGLVEQGYLQIIQVNGKTKGFVRSGKFDTLISRE